MSGRIRSYSVAALGRNTQGTLVSLAMICFLIVPSVALSAEWVFYGNTGDYEFSYDKESIIFTPQQTRKVWIKYDWSERGRSNEIFFRKKHNLFTAGYENFDHSINQYELNCKTREWLYLAHTDYGLNGNILESTDYENLNVRIGGSITPDSTIELLFKKVCVTKEVISEAT